MSARAPVPELNRDMSVASDEQLLRVVGLIDTLDRRGTVDGLLAPVRARLALLRPPRPLTLGRVVVMPFEDFLVPADEAWPGRFCFTREKLGWFVEQVPGALGPRLGSCAGSVPVAPCWRPPWYARSARCCGPRPVRSRRGMAKCPDWRRSSVGSWRRWRRC